MKKTNNNIIDEVKQFLDSADLDNNNISKKEGDKNMSNLVEKKIHNLDEIIQKEIKDWISLNAKDISMKIINDAVKKVFK